MRRKKSLVGWTSNNWDMWFHKHSCDCLPRCKPHRLVRIRTSDLIKELDVSNRARIFYKPIKVRITIEELPTKKGKR